MKFKNLADHKNRSQHDARQIVPSLYIQALGDGEGNSADRHDKLIEDVLSSQKAARRESLKWWKQDKLGKMLPERKQTRKKRLQKNSWLWQSLQSGYIAVYQSIGQALYLLPIQILKVLQDLKKLMILGAKYNGLPHQRALPSKNRALCQGLCSENNIPLQLLKPLLTKQWLSLLQKDGAGLWTRVSGHEGLASLASWFQPHLFLSVYPPLKIYSNKTRLDKTCLDRTYFAKTRFEENLLGRILPRKAYFRKIQDIYFRGSISEKFITLKEARQSTSRKGEVYERS